MNLAAAELSIEERETVTILSDDQVTATVTVWFCVGGMR